jgi:hypothetical protein
MLMRRLVLGQVLALVLALFLAVRPSITTLGWAGAGREGELRWSAVLSQGACWRGGVKRNILGERKREEERGLFCSGPQPDELGGQDHACSMTQTRLSVPPSFLPSFLFAPAPFSSQE